MLQIVWRKQIFGNKTFKSSLKSNKVKSIQFGVID